MAPDRLLRSASPEYGSDATHDETEYPTSTTLQVSYSAALH